MLKMSAADLHAFIERDFPQAGPLNFHIQHLDEAKIRLAMDAGHAQLRPGDTVSGPTLVALADCALYFLIMARLGPVALAVTTNLSINFMRKAAAGTLIADGELQKLGRRLAVGQVGIRAASDPALIAHATLTYAIPPR